MAVELFMPALSPTMEKGTLARWLKKEGDAVKSGDILAEIETDKATMEYEAVDEGILAKILVADGSDDVAVGTLIGLIAEEGEDPASLKNTAAAAPAAPAVQTAQPAAPAQSAPQTTNAPMNMSVSEPTKPSAPHSNDRLKASPLARRMAEQAGLDLATIAATGPGGRVVKRDIEARLAASAPQNAASQNIVSQTVMPQAAATNAVASAAPVASYDGPHADTPHHIEKLSNMRKTIARRLSLSKTTVPHFYLSLDCVLDQLLAQRQVLNKKLDGTGTKLSVNDFIIRAVALALKKVPAANVQFAGDTMICYDRADISVAVAIDGGLVTPVIRGADQKGLADISKDMKELATKARDGKLMPEDYAGGTFSISNLGMFGIREFAAVINPPQGCILAVGAGEQRPVVKDGALGVATVMTCTLSCDHRAVDGAVGAEFLAAFKAYIEDPLMMML